jgi:hypothetical protein
LLLESAIPKVLTAQENAVKKAVLKEAYSNMYAVLHELVLNGDILYHPPGNSNFNLTKLTQKMNAIKVCTTDPYVAGCTTTNSSVWDQQGFILPNGMYISVRIGWYIDFLLDYNGDKPPNTVGEDQLIVFYNDINQSWDGRKPGQLNVYSGDWSGVNNFLLYSTLWR